MKDALGLALVVVVSLCTGCKTLSAQAVRAESGDTILTRHEGKLLRVQIKGLFLRRPETAQAALADLVSGQTLTLRISFFAQQDDYGRWPAHVFLGERNVANTLVHYGVAIKEKRAWDTAGDAATQGTKITQASGIYSILAAILAAPYVVMLL